MVRKIEGSPPYTKETYFPRTKEQWIEEVYYSLRRRCCSNAKRVARMMYYEYWYPDPSEAAAIYVSERGLEGICDFYR